VQLATIRTKQGTVAVRLDQAAAVELGDPDLGAFLSRPDWRARAAEAKGPVHDRSGLDFAPLVPGPQKIICVGLNYRHHILEMGRELPSHPTLFAKFSNALIGAFDPIVLPRESQALDWEAELAVVVGAPARRVSPERAWEVIAGWSALNDVSARDWQYRSAQWLQGKTFEATTPLGPWLSVPDSPGPLSASIRCVLNGETVQEANTSDLLFGPAELISYISQVTTLRPGDVIATGTPGGVGHARTPPRYLTDGDVLETVVEGVAAMRNTCRAEPR
jgi:acylpyruvate hydrolase